MSISLRYTSWVWYHGHDINNIKLMKWYYILRWILEWDPKGIQLAKTFFQEILILCKNSVCGIWAMTHFFTILYQPILMEAIPLLGPWWNTAFPQTPAPSLRLLFLLMRSKITEILISLNLLQRCYFRQEQLRGLVFLPSLRAQPLSQMGQAKNNQTHVIIALTLW